MPLTFDCQLHMVFEYVLLHVHYHVNIFIVIFSFQGSRGFNGFDSKRKYNVTVKENTM
jgi:hypothetical protein